MKEQGSSIFSFRQSAQRLLVLGAAAITILWGATFFLEEPCVRFASDYVGPKLEVASKGRVPSAPSFLRNRFGDFRLLLATAVAVLLVSASLTPLIGRLANRWARTLAACLLGVVMLNGIILAFSKTFIAWAAVYAAHPTFKETSFQLERKLLAESDASQRVAVIGSSQAASQIDAGQLTEVFYPRVKFGMMHFAGASASDYLVFWDHLQSCHVNAVVIYMSEQAIYTQTTGHVLLPLASPRSLMELNQLGINEQDIGRSLIDGGIGLVFPVYRHRRALAVALMGAVQDNGVRSILPRRTGELPPASIEEQAIVRSQTYRLGPGSDFQKACLRRFLEHCDQAKVKVFLIKGQLNPLLESSLPQEIRTDFAKFIQEIHREFTGVEPLGENIAKHSVREYSDLMHLKKKYRGLYTDRLALEIEIALGRLAASSSDADRN